MKFELGLAALFFGAAVAAGNTIDGLAGNSRLPVVGTDRNIRAERSLDLKFAVGFATRKATADMRLIDMLQYCSGMPFVLDRGKDLYARAAHRTDLDPQFVHAYRYAGSILMWECDRPVEAVALLKKGMAFNPEEERLKLYLAAIVYSRLNELESEVVVLERLAFERDAPIILRRILTNAYAKQGRIGRAADVCRLVLATSASPNDRRWASVKLRKFSRKLEQGSGK